MRINDTCLEGVHSIIFCESMNPIPVEWALKRMGEIDTGYFRLPLAELDESYFKIVEESVLCK